MSDPKRLATVHFMVTTPTLPTATKRTMNALQAWWNDEAGVTAIEYGLLAALIVVVAISGISLTGASLGDMYTKWSAAVIAAINGN